MVLCNTAFSGALTASVICASLFAEEVSTTDFDFLDYLGSMVEEDGEWLDPMAMETITETEITEVQPETIGDGPEMALEVKELEEEK